jgi:hypothetical protein
VKDLSNYLPILWCFPTSTAPKTWVPSPPLLLDMALWCLPSTHRELWVFPHGILSGLRVKLCLLADLAVGLKVKLRLNENRESTGAADEERTDGSAKLMLGTCSWSRKLLLALGVEGGPVGSDGG